ncbi:hypothetical protein F5884DRAFT_754677 [Xylogone sp. PMI_703]|nr:hypothetical protein F5884DRAFT_754677 [Xylogone sp. PMI_703]
MSISVRTSSSESEDSIKTLLKTNLLSVFNERNDLIRRRVIEETYTDDVVWFETHTVNYGKVEMQKVATKLLEDSPGFQFNIKGKAQICQNMGSLEWTFGPAENPSLMQGLDVIIVQDGKIKVIWKLQFRISFKQSSYG